MLVIGDTVAIGIAVLVHDRTGLAAAGLAEYVGNFQVTPGILELCVTVHRADTLHLFQVTVGAGHSVHDVLIGGTGLNQLNDFVSVTGFALMFHGHLAALLKGVRKIDTFVEVATSVLVGVGAVRLLVELRAVLEDVGAVFRGFTTGNVTVERGETSIHL